MTALIVTSTERYSGKSSLLVGLAMEYKDRGLSVGYMKPVGSYPVKIDNKRVDEDAYFIKETLGLEDSLSDMSPYFLTWENLSRYMRKPPGDSTGKVKKCFSRIAEGKDLVLIEAGQTFVHGEILGLSALRLAGILDAGLLFLDTFREELSVDRIVAASEYFAPYFLGAVVNWVPEWRVSFCKNLLRRFMEHKGIEVLGSIPADKVLRSISVDDLAEALGGRIICAADRGEELIESMMVGAMGQEQALRLFRKAHNKVVVTGGDRSDIQLAALETATKALILTGGSRPSPIVLGQAEEMGVPIIIVDSDTATAVEMVENAIGKQKVHSPTKVERIREFIREEIDLDALLEMIERAGSPTG